MFHTRWIHAFKSLRASQGGWTAFIYFIVTLILSVALSPKAQKPKAAALDDFDVPVAEEDRPIPVLFGTKRITGANVVWYGNLKTEKIKKSGLTGSTTVGYKYFLGMHLALGHGPFDAITKIETGDKETWIGNVTGNATIAINKPSLYGGREREGGIVGDADICMGAPTQTPSTYLASAIRGPFATIEVPAFRGVTCIVWKGGYVGNTPYVKAWAVTARRILQGWSGGTAWYPAAATIGTGMNPAHIIYQCLTDSEWGQGSPSSTIDTDSFTAAADTLLAEGFGLNLLWNQASTIEDFINIVLDHIGGMLTFNQSTGQYMLELIRGDYDVDTLETFGPETISEVSNFERRSWGETVNELTLTYTDSATGEATTITVQDLGNIRSQGVRIAESIDMSGIDSTTLIRTVAGRELAARSTPLTKFDFRCNRRLWRYRPGDVVKLFWPEYELPITVFRVLQLGRGTHQDGKMTVSVIEDIYALGGIEYAESQPPEPTQDPPYDPPEPSGSSNVKDNSLSTPPATPADGDRYFIPVGTPADGVWAGHEGDLAEWDEVNQVWMFDTVPAGTIFYSEDTAEYFSVDEYGAVGPPPWGAGGGGAITIVDEDAAPDEVVAPAEVIFIKGAEVQDMGTGGVRIVVSPATTKGDIATRSAAGGYVRVPVGSEAQYLRARSAETGGLKWENAPPVGEGASGCRVYKNATQSIPDATLTALTWPVEEYDTDAYHSTSVNPSRFIVPVDGKYTVGCAIKWDSNTTGTRELYIVVNGVTATRKAGSFLPASAGLIQSVVDTLSLVAGDYIEFFVTQNSTAARDVTDAEQISSAFIARVGVTAAPTLMRGATWVRTVGTINTPVNDVHVRCPVKGVIVGVTVGTTGGPGSCVVDIWKDTHANYPPTVADTICASAKPTISSGSKYEDTTLTGWTTAIAAGDWLVFHLDSSVAFKAIFVQLYIKETQ